ncbi:MAG: class I SAM-dependent methyltransferase [Acidobacteria bacterium]|nr:class I SAM-dependent methyltransferase [Acidobacteriota bacterium]
MKKLKYEIEQPLDSPERTLFHGELIRKKKFLRRLYEEWYGIYKLELDAIPAGRIVELGSGGGFINEIIDKAIRTDILPLPTNDRTFSALDMPFSDNEISALLMIDTFHHIPDSGRFLEEAARVLKPGGKIVMVEPANSLWGRFIYRKFHHEPFDPRADWTIPESGPMSGANGALPWIVFVRDREKFLRDFPELKIGRIKYHTPLRYLISGGVSFRQLMPGFSYNFWKLTDRILCSVSRELSMFVTIVVHKV